MYFMSVKQQGLVNDRIMVVANPARDLVFFLCQSPFAPINNNTVSREGSDRPVLARSFSTHAG